LKDFTLPSGELVSFIDQVFPLTKKEVEAQERAVGSAAAENAYLAVDNSNVAINNQADTSKYNALQKKAVDFISKAKFLSQFGDRDSDPGFVSNVVEPAIAKWLDNPSSAKSTQSTIESQKSQYFTS